MLNFKKDFPCYLYGVVTPGVDLRKHPLSERVCEGVYMCVCFCIQKAQLSSVVVQENSELFSSSLTHLSLHLMVGEFYILLDRTAVWTVWAKGSLSWSWTLYWPPTHSRCCRPPPPPSCDGLSWTPQSQWQKRRGLSSLDYQGPPTFPPPASDWSDPWTDWGLDEPCLDPESQDCRRPSPSSWTRRWSWGCWGVWPRLSELLRPPRGLQQVAVRLFLLFPCSSAGTRRFVFSAAFRCFWWFLKELKSLCSELWSSPSSFDSSAPPPLSVQPTWPPLPHPETGEASWTPSLWSIFSPSFNVICCLITLSFDLSNTLQLLFKGFWRILNLILQLLPCFINKLGSVFLNPCRRCRRAAGGHPDRRSSECSSVFPVKQPHTQFSVWSQEEVFPLNSSYREDNQRFAWPSKTSINSLGRNCDHMTGQLDRCQSRWDTKDPPLI